MSDTIATPGITGNVAMGGRDGRQLNALLEKAIRQGTDFLNGLTQVAVHRLAKLGAGALSLPRLFNDDEIQLLIEIFAATRGTADQLGRALIRDFHLRLLDQVEPEQESFQTNDLSSGTAVFEAIDDLPTSIITPERAVAFFSDLVPTIGKDPQRFGHDMRRQAFTLAVATDQELLKNVQAVIRHRLETGQGIGTASLDIQSLMDRAGVSPRNPQYAEAVFRTNVMDAYNQAFQDEYQDPDLQEAFPVWQYSNPNDTRSRQAHADRDGLYYPANVPFTSIRGTEPKDVINCRCVPLAISKFEWAALKRRGVRLAPGFQEIVTSLNGHPQTNGVPSAKVQTNGTPAPIRSEEETEQPVPSFATDAAQIENARQLAKNFFVPANRPVSPAVIKKLAGKIAKTIEPKKPFASLPDQQRQEIINAALQAIADKKPVGYWGSHWQPFVRPGPNPNVSLVLTRDNPQSGEPEVLLLKRPANDNIEGGKWQLPESPHDTHVGPGQIWRPDKQAAEDAALQQAAQQTGVDPTELRQHLERVGFFGALNRDPRNNSEAWSVATAFKLQLPAGISSLDQTPPNATWVPLSSIRPRAGRVRLDGEEAPLAFDHFAILKLAKILGRLRV